MEPAQGQAATVSKLDRVFQSAFFFSRKAFAYKAALWQAWEMLTPEQRKILGDANQEATEDLRARAE